MMPQPGDVLCLGKAASVQFVTPILFRVIRVHSDWSTYEGWVWLDGYQLNNHGDAVERRSVFVQISGLRIVGDNQRRPLNTRSPIGTQRTGNEIERRPAGNQRVPQQK